MYNWNFARDFPQLIEPIIDRTHLLETIIQILSPETPVVFLEGEEGYGATTTQAQFCKAYPNQTFSLFIKPASRFANNPDYLRLALYEQFHWYLYAKPCDRDYIDVTEYDSLLLKIRRKRKSSTLYFVVDGLHQIPQEDQRQIEQIVKEVLPIGIDNFRFLISGNQDQLGKSIKQVGSKPYQQLKFSPAETEQYLVDLNLNHGDIQEIGKLCKGIPGRLASVRRLLQSGESIESLRNIDPSKYLEFIRKEFDALKSLTLPQTTLIAVLAFGKRSLAEEELVKVAQASNEDLQAVKKNCRFLESNPQTGMLEFVSESHRRYAERALESSERKAISLQVDYLLINPQSPVALRFLPTYYQQLNQQQAIVDLLSAEHYTNLLESTQSITALRNRADLGARSALHLKQAADIFKFALQRSIFTAVAEQDGLESEVAALVALGQSQRALALASKATAKETRLSLLATFAKRVKEKTGGIDPALVNYIQELAAQINFEEYGDRSVDLAANILFVDPDLAISIVEQASKRTSAPERIDAAFVQLSLAASLSKIPPNSSVADKVKSKIGDESLQKLMTSFSTILSKSSSAEIIQTVEHMESGHRLYFLKTFIDLRQDDATILDIVDYALDLIIRDTAYTPKAIDLAELARPLPYVKDQLDRLKSLTIRFESQLGLIQNSAVSKDLVLLQMRIAGAELKFDIKSGTDRIERAYYDVASLNSPEIQMECYALMLRYLGIIDKDGAVNQRYGYSDILKTELANTLENVLAYTASHFDVVRGALRALSQFDPKLAFDLAGRLNTEDRREDAYGEVARVIASHHFSHTASETLKNSLEKISDPYFRAQTLQKVADTISRNRDKEHWVDTLRNLDLVSGEPEFSCRSVLTLFAIEISCNQNPSVSQFEERFSKLVTQVESKLSQIDLHFGAVEILADKYPEVAAQHYELGRKLKQEGIVNSGYTQSILTLCLALILRSLSPLFKTGQLLEEQISRFASLVDLIPSIATKGRLYAELAARVSFPRFFVFQPIGIMPPISSHAEH